MSSPQKPFDPDDLVTAGVVADPYPAYRALRERSPVRYLYIPDGGDDFAQKLSQPSEDEAEIVACGGEDGIGLVGVRPSAPAAQPLR